MVQSLEQYVAEATNAYKPAQTAIKTQLGALSGQLDTANQQINKNYAQQQAGLNRQRNMAAETASMQAAGSGGSFGGASNLANRRYYDQSFVPAQTQLQTNQSNELAQARQNYENQRTSLNAQAAQLESQANQQALAQYYSALEAERQREWEAAEAEKARQAQIRAQREAAAASNSQYQYLMDAMRRNGGFEDWVKNYSGYNNTLKSNILGLLSNTGKMVQNISPNGILNRMTRNTITGGTDKVLKKYYDAYNNWRNA